jgi:hypothetical protein
MATYPATINLEERSAPALSVESVANEPKLRRYFSVLAAHYSTLLAGTTRDARLVSDLGNVTYLIDADVIRNIIEVRYRDGRLQREAARLFDSSSFQYALPLGAFQELIEWLRGLVPNRINWTEESAIGKSLDRKDTIRELALAFDISQETDHSGELIDRIFSVIGSYRSVIERLTDLLTRPNFRGVIADYDLGDVADLNRMLGLMQRPSLDVLESRVRRDYRDAINMAIICQASRSHLNDPSPTSASYVMITQTDALLHLVANLHDLDRPSLQLLSRLFGFEGMLLEGLYPVVSARRAFIVEDIRRRYGLSKDAIAKLTVERRVYDDLSDALRETPNACENTERISGLLGDRLGHLAKVYYGSDSFYRTLEQDRAIEASLRYLEDKHRVEAVPGKRRLAKLRLETESFFRVLHRFRDLTNNLATTSYLLTQHIDETATFESLAIHSTHPVEAVADGEVYSDPSTGSPCRAYSFRWLTSCTERQFFSALSAIIRPSKRVRSSKKRFTLHALSAHSVFEGSSEREKILIFTNRGLFGSSFDDLPRQFFLKHLSVDVLWRAVLEASGDDMKETSLDVIRVCTPFADFQLDLSPDASGNREVFVISHINIGEQIAYLCECTSLFAIFPAKLNEILQQVTSRFPPYISDVNPRLPL